MQNPHSSGGARIWPMITWIVLAVPGLLLTAWFWIRFCRFPLTPWNDLRLAPTIALAQGLPAYASAGEGPITTWVYGPLPLLFNLPAALAPDAAGAMLIAAALNLMLTLVPVALVCYRWPGATATSTARERTAALLLCLALWPELHYSTLFSDNLVVALGLLGNLALVRSSGRGGLWLAAAAATATLACKQIALGVPLAQILWLGITSGWREAARHAGRCTVIGIALGGAGIAIFGWSPLYFTLVEIPRNIPRAADVAARFQALVLPLTIQVGAPLLVLTLLWLRGQLLERTLLLPCLAWACTLPFGLAGTFTSGGWVNSMHGFVLWLPPMLVAFLTATGTRKLGRYREFAAALAALAVVSGRLQQEPSPSLRPQVQAYREAAELAASYPQGIWFPLNPLVTLYSDHRYYHDEDGLYARLVCGYPPAPQHLAAGLPPGMRFIAFQYEVAGWGIARGMMPPQSREIAVGNWTLLEGLAEPPR